MNHASTIPIHIFKIKSTPKGTKFLETLLFFSGSFWFYIINNDRSNGGDDMDKSDDGDMDSDNKDKVDKVDKVDSNLRSRDTDTFASLLFSQGLNHDMCP